MNSRLHSLICLRSVVVELDVGVPASPKDTITSILIEDSSNLRLRGLGNVEQGGNVLIRF